MTRFSLSLVGAAAAAFVLAPAAALAGPVTSGSGSVRVDFTEAGSIPASDATFPVTFPGSATLQFTGDDPANEEDGPAGLGRAVYNLADAENGATFDLDISNDIEGGVISESGSTAFLLNFTTDRALRYTLTANVQHLPLDFRAGVDGVVTASAFVTVDELGSPVLQGTFPQADGEFGTFTQEGVLPAGTYIFRASATSGVDAAGTDNNVFNTFGTVRLGLEADGPTPNPIPLPPGAWPALGTMAAAAGVRVVRRRRFI